MSPIYLHRILLAIFGFGLLGVAAELILLEHYEDVPQLIPFAAIALGLAAGAWYGRRPGRASRRAFLVVTSLFALVGVLGLVLHYRGNVEFERERDPALSGLRLVWEALTGATPALAPGTMLLLAAIAYAVTVAGADRGS